MNFQRCIISDRNGVHVDSLVVTDRGHLVSFLVVLHAPDLRNKLEKFELKSFQKFLFLLKIKDKKYSLRGSPPTGAHFGFTALEKI